MEQAAAASLSSLFAQLGVAGLILAVLIAGAVWYLKASKDLREEKRNVIADLKKENEDLRGQRDDLTEALLDCRFPNRNGGVDDEQA